MRRSLRRIRRIVLFTAWTVGCWLALVTSVALLRLFGRNVRHRRAQALTAWARRAAKIVGMKVTVDGSIPEVPFVLVSNHLGYVDVVVLASLIPMTFVAKAEISRWPFFGVMTRSAGTLYIDRARSRDIPRVLRAIEQSFRAGLGVVIFPEATSSRGSEVLPFRPPLLEAAAAGRLPVVYAALSYRTPPGEIPAHHAICWWDDLGFLPHVSRLFSVHSFEARVRFGSERVVEEDRKVLASRLHDAVVGLFEPVTSPLPKSPGISVP